VYIVVLNVLYDEVYMYKSLQIKCTFCSVLFYPYYVYCIICVPHLC